MKEIIIPYKPHALQRQLHDDTHRFRTMVCGRRFGKTVFAVNELLKKAIMKKGHYWYIAPFYGQAKEIAWLLFKKYAVNDLVVKWNESELTIYLINGSIIKLKGADKPDGLRGVGLNGVILDEFADFRKNVWDLVIRPTLSDHLGWALFLGTPKGKLNQLYEMYIKDKNKEDVNYRNFEGVPVRVHDDYVSYQFKTSDNPYIPVEEIETARLELAPAYFAQEYEANFENYTGIIYKEFRTDIHVIEPIELSPWWNIYIGIDTGRHTAVTFLAKDDKGVEYVFDEIYDYDSTVAQISAKIKHTLRKWKIDKSRVMIIIDSASQVKREYYENKIYCIDSKKEIENQISQVRSRFTKNILFFFNTCKMHIIEHQGYVWDEQAKTPKPLKENDHCVNGLQYIFSTYSTFKAIDRESIKKYKQSLKYAALMENTQKGSLS